jgi:putative membrane protein
VTRNRYLKTLALAFAMLWMVLAIAPYDRDTWILENALLVLGMFFLWQTRRALPLSTTSYSLLFMFFCLHAVGAHFTYSLVPYDEALRNLSGMSISEALDFNRNHYDRLVHFAYGFLLVLPVRELLVLFAKVRGFWSYFLPVDIVMSSSLLYELIEWGAAIVYGGNLGAAFLGTQGDEWDAHRDMALAGLGGLIAILAIFAINAWRGHDMTIEWFRSLGRIDGQERSR